MRADSRRPDRHRPTQRHSQRPPFIDAGAITTAADSGKEPFGNLDCVLSGVGENLLERPRKRGVEVAEVAAGQFPASLGLSFKQLIASAPPADASANVKVGGVHSNPARTYTLLCLNFILDEAMGNNDARRRACASRDASPVPCRGGAEN
jgi:hypothetical protein